MVPADKKLYALRDVTGTVPSIPLITASILSKKLAENLDALVLDVKFGSAAFMQTPEAARELANAMVSLGNECGVNTRAVLTDMNSPLGRAAGNWLEVKESVECLENKGPEDLRELVVAFATQLLMQTNQFKDLSAARFKADETMRSGAPRRKWDEMLQAQGADLEMFNRKLASGPTAKTIVELKADHSGFISRCDAKIIGETVRDLGGGRVQKESVINFDVGVDQIAKPGEKIVTGDTLVRIHSSRHSLAEAELGKIKSAFIIKPNFE
jgi:pyrimidine-nucleoside phosphorylase